MRVVVLGSGVIGTAAAWYLAEAGHEVVVLERQAGAGLETSFGNAGEISPGASASWAAPGIPLQALKWLFMRHRPLVVRPRLDPALIRWCLMMLRNCTAARYELNKARMLPLAEYSRDLLRALRAEIGISYDERAKGILLLFRNPKELEATAVEIAILQKFGVPFELLDRAGCIRAEPALARVQDKIAGGLRLPDDETGDCFKFTQALAAAGRQRGIEFRYGTTIVRIALDGDRVSGIVTDRGTISGDAYVVSAGSYSPLLLKPIGIRVPLYPVKGYSLTMPSPTRRARPSRASWTRPIRSRSPGLATASGSAAWRNSRATISSCGRRRAGPSSTCCATCSRTPATSPTRASGAACGR